MASTKTATLLSIPRGIHDKHTVCLAADHNMVVCKSLMDRYKSAILNSPVRFLEFATTALPDIPVKQLTLQDQMNNIIAQIPNVICYIKIRGCSQANIPTDGENGLVWLKEYSDVFRRTRNDFYQLGKDIIFVTILLVYIVRFDISHHPGADKYGDIFEYIITNLIVDLIDTSKNTTTQNTTPRFKDILWSTPYDIANDPLWKDFWEPKLDKEFVVYTQAKLRIIKNISDVNVNEAVLNAIIRLVFSRYCAWWDHTHAMALQRVRTILEFCVNIRPLLFG